MDAFSYLSVLLSIILGLAITQVLQGVRGLLLARTRVRIFLPVLLWAGMIVAMAVQSWWASFGLADHREWTFGAFGIVLVQTILLYMLAALVLPDFPPDAPTDLHAHYYRERMAFFGIVVVMLVVSALKDVVLDRHPPSGANLAFHLVFIATGLVAMIARHRRVHEALALATAALLTSYIALLFARLG